MFFRAALCLQLMSFLPWRPSSVVFCVTSTKTKWDEVLKTQQINAGTLLDTSNVWELNRSDAVFFYYFFLVALFVARQALSCLLSLDSSVLVPVDKINSVLR